MSQPKHDTPILPSGYTFIKKLGQGGYGSVYACRDNITGKELAVKQLKWTDSGIPSIMEANIMSTMSQPHLVKAEKIILDGQNLFLFQPRAKCDLDHLIRKEKNIPPPSLLRQWSFCLVQAIACLHQRRIVHADIKASNILLFENDIIRLADFNLSQKMFETSFAYRSCTCTHRPIEVWLDQDWGMPVDIWSLGCTLFEIAYGMYLFPYQGWDKKVDKWLLKDRFILCLDDFARMGPSGPQVVPFTYNRNTCKYLSFRLPDTFNHPDYVIFNQLVLSMLRFNPEERPKITSIIEHPYFKGMAPSPYQTIVATEEVLPPRKEAKYIESLNRLTPSRVVVDVAMSIVRKVQHLRFRYSNLDDERVRLLGACWLANKLVLRRTPSLIYSLSLMHRIESRICEYLSYRLIV